MRGRHKVHIPSPQEIAVEEFKKTSDYKQFLQSTNLSEIKTLYDSSKEMFNMTGDFAKGKKPESSSRQRYDMAKYNYLLFGEMYKDKKSK